MAIPYGPYTAFLFANSSTLPSNCRHGVACNECLQITIQALEISATAVETTADLVEKLCDTSRDVGAWLGIGAGMYSTPFALAADSKLPAYQVHSFP